MFFLDRMPWMSAYIAMEHGFSSFGVRNLAVASSVGVGPTIVLHLNHEQPWTVAETADVAKNDFTFNTTAELIEAYRIHPLVLRNYYYEVRGTHTMFSTLIYLGINNLIRCVVPFLRLHAYSHCKLCQRTFRLALLTSTT
jgi:hypothetical protein